ncbi:hypothetical protein EELLY_v1c02390 [Entomoplasma ellychniae]|uniref:Uncharacterized protein n=1 Tax=Entomoplasma ellychniae TaxID=2114 RepID=A0A8E2U9W2_9MOLU|nr:hypothetical protein [Entomoplasma ellychniae]PPE04559.1 hypothetical protein EELLY_v1c02390 [Entomoplasma ellychniae]
MCKKNGAKTKKETRELLSDLNKKINSNNISEKQKAKDLLFVHKKITNKLLVWSLKLFILFLIDIFLLITVITLFITNMFLDNNTLVWIIISLSLLILVKFTYMNWFSKNLFYKKIVVFNFKSKVDKHKFQAYREISFTPIWFWIFFVGANFIVAVIINYQIQGILLAYGKGNKWNGPGIFTFWAISRAMLDMMLLPSFLNAFGKIAEKDKAVESNYVKLIKDQYFSNKSLFEDVEFEENYLNLKFNKNNFSSRNGLFIFVNKDDLTRPDQSRMIEINKEILECYKEIWESYIDLLENRMKAKFNKTTVHTLYWLERIYDKIFLDLFDI